PAVDAVDEEAAAGQARHGVVLGLGMALAEQTCYDPRSGRPLSGELGDYLMPVCADVPEVAVYFMAPPTAGLPGGVSLVELGLAGVAPAVANAVYHATGVRVRALPLTPDRLMP